MSSIIAPRLLQASPDRPNGKHKIMARVSKIGALPPGIRDWLDNALAEGNFSGYQLLSEELKTRGYDISHAAVHRYGQKLEKRIAAIKSATDAAQMLAKSLPDATDDLSSAVIRMVQSDMFDLLVSLQESSDEANPAERLKLLSHAVRAAADATRASVTHRKWQDEARARTQAAAASAEKIARKGGLSAESVEQLRREILGIVA
jgi:hypothetical protein